MSCRGVGHLLGGRHRVRVVENIYDNIRRSRYIDRYRVIHGGNRKEGDSSARESTGDVE